MRLLFGGSGPLRLAGGTIMATELMRGLQAQGHEVLALTEEGPEPWWPEELPHVVGTFDDLDVGGFDAILTGPYGVEPALAAGAAKVVHFVAGFEPDLWPPLRERFGAIYRLPTLKAVIAPHIQRSIKRLFGLESIVVGSPIDLRRFTPGGKRADRIGPPRVLTVGPEPDTPYAPVPFKGIKDVIEIVRRARDLGNELELVRLTPRDDSLSSSEQIDELHVAVPPAEVVDLYRGCEVYLGASTPAEGLGMPPFEAACSGVVPIVPEIPSFLETPGLADCALFYPAGDLDAGAERLMRVLGDAELRERLSEVGPRSGLVEHFDPGGVAARLATAIEAFRP